MNTPYPFDVNRSSYSKNVSVIVPVKNERDNIKSLIDEIRNALVGESYEIIYIDDGSDDGTFELLKDLKSILPELRVIRHNISCGQSVALRSGVIAARSPLIIMLDGDGQNDPADIPLLLHKMRHAPASCGLVAGQRFIRNDGASKRYASKIANSIRQYLLKDGVRDTGCGLKAFKREAFLLLPFFNHIHRYLPALMLREGWTIVLVDVNHRNRTMGESKYGNWGRLKAGILDLCGVMWLIYRKRKLTDIYEL